jgi:hypothetical protein
MEREPFEFRLEQAMNCASGANGQGKCERIRATAFPTDYLEFEETHG